MNCKFLVVSSITYALKGKSELERNNIPCKIEKLDDIALQKGCGYGIRINAGDTGMSARLLRRAGIRVIDTKPCQGGEL